MTGKVVEIETPLSPVSLFLVFSAEDGKALLESGVPRGRILSPKEVETLRPLKGDAGALRALLETKIQFDARVQDIVHEAKP